MKIPKKVGGRPSKRPINAQLAMMYQSMTAKEIAEELNVSVHTVRNWISQARKEERADAEK